MLENAAHGDAADGARELQRSGGDSALAGGDGNSFAGIPLAMEYTFSPFRRRHQAGFFGREINAGAMAQAHFGGVVREAINAQLHAYVVEKNVAGIEDGFTKVDDAVRTLSVDPALKLASVKSGVAGAEGGVAFRGNFVFQHGGGGNDFEDGAGSELGLDGAI